MGKNMEYIRIKDIAEIGSLIRKRRKATGMTLATMASLMGVSTRFLGELERGRSTVAAGSLLQVMQAVGIDLFVKPRS